METIISHQPAPCPGWCGGGHEPGDPHTGMAELDANTTLLLSSDPSGAVSAEILGEPTATAEHGSVALSAEAVARLAATLARFADEAV